MIRLLILACLVLGACGFRPVYGPQSVASGVSIAEIEGRTGYALRLELMRSLSAGLPASARGGRLDIRLSESMNRLAFAPDQAASRSDYVGTARFVLRSQDGNILAEGSVTEAASFNFADAAFADISAQSAAQDRLAALLAQSIRQALISALLQADAAAG